MMMMIKEERMVNSGMMTVVLRWMICGEKGEGDEGEVKQEEAMVEIDRKRKRKKEFINISNYLSSIHS